jgi:chemotaxis protein MotB
MQAFKAAILVASLAALAGCANWQKDSSVANSGYDTSPICSKTHGWQPWPDSRCNPPEAAKEPGPDLAAELAAAQKQNSALSRRASDLERQVADSNREIATLQSSNSGLKGQLAASMALAAGLQAGAGDKDKLAADLAEARQRNVELERQLADRDKELAGLRGELSTEMAKLKEAQRGLVRALRPEIEKGDITVDLNSERLMINLASSYLFGSGQAELKPAGADALKQVGAVLKDFPEYKVAVDGHTDNVAIRGALKKTFPTNKELSESRAANAAKALTEGGLGAATTHGYADTKPVESNTTDAGRAKNRRVEIRVTK